MGLTNATHNISISIERPASEVYEFASRPTNFPRWATGLASSLRPEGEFWVSDSPEGEVRVRFTPPNQYGVLDHHVTLPNGNQVYIPMRVVANGGGSEVLFTLFVTPGMTEEIVKRDIAWVERDLRTLKGLLEGSSD